MADSVSVYDVLEVGCMTVQDVVGLRRERDALQAERNALQSRHDTLRETVQMYLEVVGQDEWAAEMVLADLTELMKDQDGVGPHGHQKEVAG